MMRQNPDDDGLALRHARGLLAMLGCRADPVAHSLHPALAWRRSGLMAVTGRADGSALVVPAALTCAAEGALAAFRRLAPAAARNPPGWTLLGERARLLGLRRQGRISASGSCRLLAARGGSVALNLARPDDWDLMPALLGEPCADWSAVEHTAASWPAGELVARGREMGLPIAPSPPVPDKAPMPFTIERLAPPRPLRRPPLVIDLSSLWAGPLASSLLEQAGARVIKVESRHRPDAARDGDPHFFDLLNAGKQSVVIDFRTPDGMGMLHALLDRADIVIEASRPRALIQLGVDARAAARRGATWLSITAHGRVGAAADWIGFGDDVAVGAGVASIMADGWGEPMFAGDALADPMTGITAALAAWAAWQSGGGCLVSVPMIDVVAHASALYRPDQAELQQWQALAETDHASLAPLREIERRAAPWGSDTADVQAWLDSPSSG